MLCSKWTTDFHESVDVMYRLKQGIFLPEFEMIKRIHYLNTGDTIKIEYYYGNSLIIIHVM